MTGKPLLDKILIGANALGLLAAVGLIAYTQFFFKKPLPNNTLELQHLRTETVRKADVELYKLDKMTINLRPEGSRLRFLDLEVYLQPFEDRHTALIKANRTALMDMIISILGEMTGDDVNSISGKVLLEGRIKERFNEFVGEPAIKKILFPVFVVS